MKKKILIFGGAGYVGTVLSAYLLKKGYQVEVFDYFVYNNQHSILSFIGDNDYQLVKGDITDVIILAGLVGDPITKKYQIESEKINDAGVKNCINYFKGKKLDKLIFVSTCSNYGLIKDNEIADENFILNPLSLYAKAKVSCENFLLSQRNTADYTGIVFRFATAFGLSPRMRFDLSVSEFTKSLFFNEELLVFDENTWRPYCHVMDFARLLEIAINADKKSVNFEVFNAGGDKNNFTKKMLINEILKSLPNAKIQYGTQGNDQRNYKVSFDKVKQFLGFEPIYEVSHGIIELIEALNIGLYSDANSNKNKYGNYEITIN